MTEQAAEQATEVVEPQGGEEQTPESFDKDYVEKLRREAADYRTKLRAAEKEAEEQRRASMTEAEKAVAEAEARGRTAAASEFGKRLARSEIKASAAEAGADLDGVFDYLDVGRFVTEDGEPDSKAIGKFVAGLPKKQQDATSFDGGSRRPAGLGASMNDLIRGAVRG